MTEMQANKVKYRISPVAVEQSGLSLVDLARSRMCGDKACPSCSQNSTFETPKDVMSAISRGCSKRDGYLGVGMTILEVTFRVLLSKNNKPQTLEVIVNQLAGAWNEYIHLKNRHPETVARVLEFRNDYGITRVS